MLLKYNQNSQLDQLFLCSFVFNFLHNNSFRINIPILRVTKKEMNSLKHKFFSRGISKGLIGSSPAHYPKKLKYSRQPSQYHLRRFLILVLANDYYYSCEIYKNFLITRRIQFCLF